MTSGKTEASSSRSRDIKCFKCLGRGHIVSQCPSKEVMIMTRAGEVETDDEEQSEASTFEGIYDVEYPVEGDLLVTKKN